MMNLDIKLVECELSDSIKLINFNEIKRTVATVDNSRNQSKLGKVSTRSR
jgi:hypothetical protein